MGAENNVQKDRKNNKIKNGEVGILRQKEFKARNSLLTDLFEIDHFKSIKHCFVAIMIIAIMNMFICDILVSGSSTLGLRYIIIGFDRFHEVIAIWIAMFYFTLLVHPVFSIWAKLRIKLNPKSLMVKLWDRLWIAVLLIFIALFLYYPPYIKGNDFPIASSAVILGEQIRMVMKIHAFVRSNAARVRSFKQHSEQTYPVPVFSKYFYFLFVPTFVYRDEYPRTKEIRWSFVFLNFLEVATGICFYSFLTANYLVPDFEKFGLEPRNWRTVTGSIFRMMLPSSMIMLIGFYIILHAWLNAWAEMLRFADRLFYLDWWNSATFAAYYRKWNIVVHDYLHLYFYRDMYEIIVPGNKTVATMVVFLMSALVHEYVIGFMVGFFFPVMFVEFAGIGMTLSFIKMKDRPFVGNIFMWWALTVGIGIQISLYMMEYYARINCPKENKNFVDYFVPRMITCNV